MYWYYAVVSLSYATVRLWQEQQQQKEEEDEHNKYHNMFLYVTLFACYSTLNIHRGGLELFANFSRVFADIYLWFVRFYVKISIK